MKIIISVFTLLYISGCIGVPELSSSKKTVAKEQIRQNKVEAQEAQEEYKKLQKYRNRH